MIAVAALIALFQQALDEKWGYIWGSIRPSVDTGQAERGNPGNDN